MTKRIDIEAITPEVGTRYPPPFHEPVRERVRKRLGDAVGLTQFGVNLIRLPPGAWSSQRHWHTAEDEFVFVVEGQVILVTELGDEVLQPGDCAGFVAGQPDGHHFQNRSEQDVLLLEVGSRNPESWCHYSDIDMVGPPHDEPAPLTHRDGRPYEDLTRRGPGE